MISFGGVATSSQALMVVQRFLLHCLRIWETLEFRYSLTTICPTGLKTDRSKLSQANQRIRNRLLPVCALQNGATRGDVGNVFAYSAEFQNVVGQLCVSTSSSSPSYKYVLSDLQGTTRAVMNNSGSSSSVIARHDYLPFGEEIWSGTGTRASSQGYGKTDAIRGKYGLTERDDATGLDHTWWRKLENFSGRWTSPDPYNGSMSTAAPQSLHRYNYTQNDPVNFIDPSGLYWAQSCSLWALFDVTDPKHPKQVGAPWVQCTTYWVDDLSPLGGPGGGPGVGGGVNQKPKNNPTPLKPTPQKTQAEKQKDYEDCVKRAGAELKAANDAIPNIFHNAITADDVGSAAYQGGAIAVVTGIPTGGAGILTGLTVFGGNVVFAFGYRSTRNFFRNTTERSTAFGKFLHARAECKHLLN